MRQETGRLSPVIAREDLIGEEFVLNPEAFAERMFAEFRRLLASPGWQTLPGRGKPEAAACLVETCGVGGAFASAGVLLTRATGIIEIPAEALFDHLVSAEGYAVIDPMSDPRDHLAPALESYAWKPGCRLEAARSAARLPLMREREFVVLNAIDPQARLFVSKSILHDGCPGGSRYAGVEQPRKGPIRALNTFGIGIESLDGEKSRVRCVNYADLAGIIPPGALNFINTKFFLQALYRRMARLALARRKEFPA